MPLNINTTNPEYQRLLANAVELRDAVRPYLRHLSTLSDEAREAWLSRDPLLRGIIQWSQKIADRSEET